MELGYVHVLVLFTCISYLYDEHWTENYDINYVLVLYTC